MVIHDANAQPIDNTNPLPVTFGYSDDSYNTAISTPNAFNSAQQVKAAVSGQSIYITDIIVSSVLANTITIKDSDGTLIIPSLTLAANTPFEKSWVTPKKVASGKAVNVSTSVQAEVSVSIDGFVK